MSDLNLGQNKGVAEVATQEIAKYDWNTHAEFEGKIYDKSVYLNRKFVEVRRLFGKEPSAFPTKAIDSTASIIAKDQWITITKSIRERIRKILEIDDTMTVDDMQEQFEMFLESGGRLFLAIGTRFVNTETKGTEIVQCETRTDLAAMDVFDGIDKAEVDGSDEVKNFLIAFNEREVASAKRALEDATIRIRAQKLRAENEIAQKAKMAELRAKRKQAPSAPSAETEEVFEDSIEPAI